MLVMRNGEVIGGHDGCNGWGLSDQPGLIVSDAQECPPDQMRNVYWLIATGPRTSLTKVGDQLLVRAPGHVGTFRKP
jgi:hypothetical protein